MGRTYVAFCCVELVKEKWSPLGIWDGTVQWIVSPCGHPINCMTMGEELSMRPPLVSFSFSLLFSFRSSLSLFFFSYLFRVDSCVVRLFFLLFFLFRSSLAVFVLRFVLFSTWVFLVFPFFCFFP